MTSHRSNPIENGRTSSPPLEIRMKRADGFVKKILTGCMERDVTHCHLSFIVAMLSPEDRRTVRHL